MGLKQSCVCVCVCVCEWGEVGLNGTNAGWPAKEGHKFHFVTCSMKPIPATCVVRIHIPHILIHNKQFSCSQVLTLSQRQTNSASFITLWLLSH